MEKLWFKTQNNQIINLNRSIYFWLEEVSKNKFNVWTHTEDGHEKIGEFDDCDEALTYLNEIYLTLVSPLTLVNH